MDSILVVFVSIQSLTWDLLELNWPLVQHYEVGTRVPVAGCLDSPKFGASGCSYVDRHTRQSHHAVPNDPIPSQNPPLWDGDLIEMRKVPGTRHDSHSDFHPSRTTQRPNSQSSAPTEALSNIASNFGTLWKTASSPSGSRLEKKTKKCPGIDNQISKLCLFKIYWCFFGLNR